MITSILIYNQISYTIDLPFHFIGGQAKTLFENLRKRYNKKKNDLKKSRRSGAGTTDIEKVERALAPYKFLSWLDNFTYTRESKTNLDLSAKEDSILENEDEDGCGESDAVIDEDKPHDNNSNDSNENFVRVNSKLPNEKRKKRKECHQSSDLDQAKVLLIKSLKEDIQNQKKHAIKELNPVDLFVSSLGADLKTLSERDFILAKHEIQNIVFKYQMARYGQEPVPNSLSSRLNNNNSNNSTYYNFP